MEIFTGNTEEATKKAIECLNQLLHQYAKQPVLFLSSGGSSLKLLQLDAQNFTHRTTVSVLDERYSNDPKINNFFQLTQTSLFQKIKNMVSFIDTRIKENETMAEAAKRFEEDLRNWKNKNPGGKIIATIGVGPDGHISGMMPYPENPELFFQMFDGNEWVTAYNAGNKNEFSERITTTLPFLRMIDYGIVYITGENKRIAFHNLLTKKSLAETPASILHEMKNVCIFTDIRE